MIEPFAIADRLVGPGQPPFIVAELSGNHGGRLERALELVTAAKQAGADAVKLQTYTPDTLTIDCDGPGFVIQEGVWRGRRLYELYGEAQTPWEWHDALFARARALGMIAFSTPFDETAVDFLEDRNVPAYKIASFEMVDHPLIEKVAATGRPMILSTGMANREEIAEAVDTARAAGCRQLALLHCVSGYPTPIEEANLGAIAPLAETFAVPVGLSDHTPGTAVPIAAVALGASVIEKHFTLRRADGGPDAAFSLEPAELAAMAEGCRAAWRARGSVGYERKPSEQSSAIFRRSLYVVRDVAAGETLTRENVRAIRPGHGLAPKHLAAILGRRAARSAARGTPLDWTLVEGGPAIGSDA